MTWATKAALPAARYYLAAGVIGTKLYAVGGQDASAAATSTLYEYDQATDTWATKASMPAARYVLAAGVIGTKLYAVGGQNSSGAATSTLYEYDQGTNTWATKAPMPDIRLGLAVGVIGTKLYAVCGHDGGNPRPTLYEYDQGTNTWTTKNPPLPRYILAAGVIGTKLYAVGGNSGGGAQATVYEYDQGTDTWATKAPLPAVRQALGAGVIGTKLYAVGGQDDTSAQATLYEYDQATNTWTTTGPMPAARQALAAGVIGGKLYAVGGNSGSGAQSTLYEYDTGVTGATLTGSSTVSGESSATATGSLTSAVVQTGTSAATGASSVTTAAVLVRPAVTHNRVGGRRRSGIADATWEPAVVASTVAEPVAHCVANAFGPVTMDGTQPTYDVTTAKVKRHRDRIVVGGLDITYFRGIPTPLPAYQLVAPLLYGPATLVLPQVAASFERLGVGDLKWLRKGQRVLIQRVDDTGTVVATDYRGVIIAFNTRGRDLTVEVGGEVTGRAALRNRQVPIFRSTHDIGFHTFDAFKHLGLPFKPRLGPDTGIKLANFGGMSYLDYLNQLVARAWTTSGNQWSIMPDAQGIYRLARKDTTTIDATVYLDDARVVGDLRRDVAEEPNRIFATGVTPEGQRVRFGVYPGLKQGPAPAYPMAGNAAFSAGTVDADTLTGDGITVMIWRLQVVGYLNRSQYAGGYDADATRAIKGLQDDAGLPVTGTMNLATWRALYDLNATGYSLGWSHIEPAAQRSKVHKWNRTASGSIASRNPNYDRHALVVDANVDMGTGFTRDQIREWAKAELATEDNWVGTIQINTGAIVAGEHVPGDPIVGAAGVRRARSLKPGQNVWAPLFDGGTLFHVSGVSVAADGIVTLSVDTRARDTMKVWEVITRNRESRRDPARSWMHDHRSSGMTNDSLTEWDEIGGTIQGGITIPSHTWVVFPVVAGQEGTVRSLRLRTDPDAEFVTAVFGRAIRPGRLSRMVGNPLSKDGSKRWSNEGVRDALDEKNILLYVAGDDAQPCGYYPTTKGDPDAVLTGRWEDEAGFSYHTGNEPVLYVAVYTDRATKIPAGRIMWNQLETGA